MKSNLYLKEYRTKDFKELFLELKKAQKNLVELKFKAAFKKLKNYQAISFERKKIARIWTILSEKTIEQISKEEK